MRLIVVIVATLLADGPGFALSWREYSYPDQFFTVAFPADPQMQTTTYQVANDRSVEAQLYSVHQNDAVFSVTVAELTDTGLEEGAIIDHAVKTMSEGGEVKVNIPHRVNRVYGRQLSIVGPDGSRSMVAVFDYDRRLYLIEGKALTGNDATADAIRFVQSLIFTGGGSNRSADEIRAAQAACSGSGGSGVAGIPGGDGRRLEIRCRRQQSFVALVSSLNSGDLSGAQQAYSSLSELQRFANPNGQFAQAMSQIGEALQGGDLTGAQQALSSLQRAHRARQP
jgi:hypothetical protein